MPFAPSIIKERENDYIINPKGIDGRFMAVGFDTTDLAKDHIAAGIHPFDKTARPQIVHKKDNPEYHSLIEEFESKIFTQMDDQILDFVHKENNFVDFKNSKQNVESYLVSIKLFKGTKIS